MPLPRIPAAAARFVAGLLGLWLILSAGLAGAGVMTRTTLGQIYPPPYSVGEQARELPVWPLSRMNGPYPELEGWLFESIDFAPIPGFSGTPVNLLVEIAPDGQFRDVRVISQHEPVFLDGLGPEPLAAFVRQYVGLGLNRNIKVTSSTNGGVRLDSANAYIDGVSKATASVRIVNDSIVNAALAVARAKLGIGGGSPARAGTIRSEVLDAGLDWAGLKDKGLVACRQYSNREVERAFAGTVGEGQDPEALAAPEALYLEFCATLLNVPGVHAALLGDDAWARIARTLEPGDLVLLAFSRGRYGFAGPDFVRNAIPDRLGLAQGGLPLGLRDMDLDERVRVAGLPDFDTVKFFRVLAQAGLDPARPVELSVRTTRAHGLLYPERVSRDLGLELALPARYVERAPQAPQPLSGWRAVWAERAGELLILLAGFVLLTLLLARPAWLTHDATRLRRVRTLWLVFTLGFLGWYAQGQLSIVNLTAVIQALRAGRGLDFLLNDPMTVLVWAYTALALVVWGRGTFCGWLCPFGALQELAALGARALGLPPRRVPEALDARLMPVKYAVLALILAAAWFAPALSDRLVEIEPFKTAITLGFVRSLPFVAWALALIALNLVFYKAFCRWLCPLGAALALLGRVRVFAWLPRRAECGSPCQLCRRSCEYGAIRRDGAIRYADCFQCLDCVAIYRDRRRCAPLLLADKRAARGQAPVRFVPRAGGLEAGPS